jgi:uncharacterized membrane protein
LSNPGTYRHDDLEFARAVTFFDAIFAFAVTLLITTVDDFSAEAWSSFQALKDTNGPSLLAFAISFVVVVSFWRANHQEVTRFKALDGRLIFLNCVVMFGVVLIPFCTEAIGKLGDLPLPVAIYAVTISGTYLMQQVVVLVADRRGLRGRRMSARELTWALINAAILPLVFLGSIPLAYLVSPQAAEQSWISLAVIMPVLGWLEQAGVAKAAAVEPALTDKEAE